MPNKGAPGGENEPTYQWLHIDDFSPGVYDGSHISTESPVVSAPLGAANAVGTFACASIPGGALAPLPALTTTTDYTPDFPGSVTTLYITGFIVTPQLNNGDYEIVTLFEGDDGTDHYVIGLSYVPETASANTITGVTNSSATTSGGIFGAPYPAFTRMSVSGDQPWPPVLVFPGAVSTDSSGTNGHLWVYPELLSPTSFTAQDLIVSGSSITGQVVCYGSRVLCLAGVNFDWPSGTGINTNENINYTDPPLSDSYGEQEDILGAETPWGYGAWGSVSVGQLLLVKKYGGAIMLYGDIGNPSSVIEVPGVEPTGDFVGSAAATPTGLYYCSQNRGAWVWNGGNTSTKISTNIADDFFDMQTDVIESNNYGFFAYSWQKWVLFSKNMIFDTQSNAWWVIYPNASAGTVGHLSGRDIFWWCLTQDGNQILGAPLAMPTANRTWFSTFDNTVPSPTWQWTSLPIHVVKDADRIVNVREVVIRASDPQNTGTCQVTVTIDGNAQTNSTTIGVTPTPMRFEFGIKTGQDIQITVLGNNTNGSDGAPIMHSIDIAYNVRAQLPVES